MKRRILTIMAIVGALIGVLLAVPVVALGSAFIGNTSLENGRNLGDRVTTVVDSFVACYLVDVGDGVVLIDACNSPEAVQAALASRNLDTSALKGVLLTHSHPDHIGGLSGLPGVPVYALASAQPHLSGERGHNGPMTAFQGATDTGVTLARALSDGDTLTLGDTTFQVYAVPGHTDDSAAFLAHGVLFLGDNAGWKTSDTLAGAPWIFSDDTAQNIASLEALATRVAEADVTWLAPAHTGPAQGVEPFATL